MTTEMKVYQVYCKECRGYVLKCECGRKGCEIGEKEHYIECSTCLELAELYKNNKSEDTISKDSLSDKWC